MKIDWRRVFFFLGAAIVSVWCGWHGQPLIHESDNARSMITDVFSILAGFLMTVLTLLIEPKPTAKIWREAASKKTTFVNRIVRYKWLFMLYLSVLGMVFAANLLSKSEDCAEILVWLERAYLSLATLAFIISLMLPNQLMQLQVSRYNEMIEEKKKPDSEPK
ncbi:hypothetical protein [Pseudomonas sp. NFR16]|uniref:hypothetical protein n=1 Tax=Pseudomonas sp. NFR16 TaxID=1566248 RepID=UPI0008C8A272|nr:hypothetical protein [Pseudomonas sp. NFR16]SEJ85754.1 hypothetical protein SAMN03159495_4859 [Pseudomonas sp. NFR16]